MIQLNAHERRLTSDPVERKRQKTGNTQSCYRDSVNEVNSPRQCNTFQYMLQNQSFKNAREEQPRGMGYRRRRQHLNFNKDGIVNSPKQKASTINQPRDSKNTTQQSVCFSQVYTSNYPLSRPDHMLD